MPFITKGQSFAMDATLYGLNCDNCGTQMDYNNPTIYVEEGVWVCGKCSATITGKELIEKENNK